MPFDHSSTLCGTCQPGLSLALASSQYLHLSGAPDGFMTAVWSFDGNVQYLSPKHITFLELHDPPLPSCCLCSLLPLAGYPSQCFYSLNKSFRRSEITAYRVRKWMLRLKPFLDRPTLVHLGTTIAIGSELLVARLILLLIFGLNSTMYQ